MKHIDNANRVILQESDSLKTLSAHIPQDFDKIVDYIVQVKGKIILTGIGKSGYIARKIASSFASTGTSAFYIHPAEASHGDLGMISSQDLVVMLSNSGETKELSDMINYCKRFAIKIVAMTMRADSNLALNSDFLLQIPVYSEASIIKAPTTSALMMLSLGDALTICVQEAKGFSSDDFKLFHPGGKIGANLLKVMDLMHSNIELPLIQANTCFNDIVDQITKFKLGCVIVVDDKNKLLGIITDGDLRRSIKIKNFDSKTAKDLMHINPCKISPNCLASEAMNILSSNLITALPIVDHGKVVGILHVHDLLRAGIG